MKRKKMKKWEKILITFLVIFFIVNCVGLYAGNLCYEKVCKMVFDKNASSYQAFKSTFNYNRFNALDQRNVEIVSNFGYKLSGTYIENRIYTEDTVIIVHGITGSRWESMKYADIYLNMGYNVLVYDSRYHGKSGGKDITLGYFEKYDLENCVKWVKKLNPEGIIGVHGESMGAATALLESEMNEKTKTVKFYVSDCAFSDLPQLFAVELKDELSKYSKFVAKGIIFYSSLVALKKSGFSVYAVSPIKAIANVTTPILFIHGDKDTFIPKEMSIDLYVAKKEPKMLYIAPNAGHAESYLKNKQQYTEKVARFLQDNNITRQKSQNKINKYIDKY